MPIPRTPTLPPDAQRRLTAELQPGERLVWADAPRPRYFTAPALVAFLFAIPWTGFAVFWVVMAGGMAWFSGGDDRTPAPFKIFPLFGLPFILIGIGLLSSPIWMRRKLLRTVYAVTDRRAIVFEGSALTSAVTVRSFLPERLTSMARTERADGSGDLVFEQFRQRVGSGSTTVTRGFQSVGQVREVEALIVETLLAGRTRPLRYAGA